MYVYYAEEEAEAEIHGRRNSIGGPDRTFRRAHRAIYVLIAATSFAMLIFLISATILHWFGRVGEAWANILGVAVAVFACIQWIPQVMTSWKLGHLGSLSLASLCLSAPVSSINVISSRPRCQANSLHNSIHGYLVSTCSFARD